VHLGWCFSILLWKSNNPSCSANFQQCLVSDVLQWQLLNAVLIALPISFCALGYRVQLIQLTVVGLHL
jgi:hypothetical protein